MNRLILLISVLISLLLLNTAASAYTLNGCGQLAQTVIRAHLGSEYSLASRTFIIKQCGMKVELITKDRKTIVNITDIKERISK